jgi:transposase
MNNNSLIGLDISKNVFQVCAQDEKGHVTMKKRLSRLNVLSWFSQQPPATIGIEACGGSHYWARELKAQGHEVKILPPQHVKPFVRTNKSDAHDAQAIARALREPDIASVPIADRVQQDMQVLHRMRQRLVAERTALVNQIRGFLLEYGIALPVGVARARDGAKALLEKRPTSLSSDFLQVLQDQFSELLVKDEKIVFYKEQIEKQVQADRAGVRVMKMLGIGVLSASALLIKLRHAGTYRNGRHFAASIGLVPRHEGTGGKITIMGMSKRGDRYLRTLLIHGARTVIFHAKKRTDPLGLWIQSLVERRGANKAAVALASKHARIAWRLITHDEEFLPQKAAASKLQQTVAAA